MLIECFLRVKLDIQNNQRVESVIIRSLQFKSKWKIIKDVHSSLKLLLLYFFLFVTAHSPHQKQKNSDIPESKEENRNYEEFSNF